MAPEQSKEEVAAASASEQSLRVLARHAHSLHLHPPRTEEQPQAFLISRTSLMIMS